MAALTPTEQTAVGELYLSGKSAQQIANLLRLNLNVVTYALRHTNVPRRSKKEARRLRYESDPLSYKIKINLSRAEEDLKLAALMLYWAEGYKAGKGTVDFANSDPEMVLLFKNFLYEICDVDKSRIGVKLFCYDNQDSKSLISFWSNYLNIPTDQFKKPYIKATSVRSVRGPRMIHGLVHVLYCDKKLLQQILFWLDEYRYNRVGGGVVNRKGL